MTKAHNMNKKTILFTIEISGREIIPKCLLALELARRGFRVYIGSFRAIHEIHRNVKSCIFFHKSAYRRRMLKYKQRMNAVTAILDEEAGIAIPTARMEDFCAARFSTLTSGAYDYAFSIGEGYTNTMRAMPNMQDIRIVTTGWPRIDLWREDFSDIHSDEIKKIQTKHGDYWLFVSSFGFTSKEGMEYKLKRATSQLRVDGLRNTYQAFLNYVELLKALAHDSQKKIIIRPHISENIDEWRNIFTEHPNVEVIRQGDITPWLLAANGVITYRSIVNVQAALNGIPTVQYKINEIDGLSDLAVFKVSECVDTIEEVRNYLESFKTLENRAALKKKAESLLEYQVSSLKGTTASIKIAETLAEIPINPQPKIALPLYRKVFSQIWHWLKYAEYKVAKATFLRRSDRTSRFEKIPNGIKADEIASILKTLQSSKLVEPISMECKQALTNLVVIEKQAD
jgi:surface carbohydrate biosynthesis protein